MNSTPKSTHPPSNAKQNVGARGAGSAKADTGVGTNVVSRPGVLHFRVDPGNARPPSVLNLAFSTLSRDESIFRLATDGSGIVRAEAYDATGLHQDMQVTGDFPQEAVSFLEDDVEYLNAAIDVTLDHVHVGTRLIPFRVAYLTVRSAQHCLCYEANLCDRTTMLESSHSAPFAATIYKPHDYVSPTEKTYKVWSPELVLRSSFNLPSQTFGAWQKIDISNTSPTKIASAKDGADWNGDVSLEAYFGAELAKAAYFAPIVSMDDGQIIYTRTDAKFVVKVIGACLLGALAGGAKGGGAVGAAIGCALAGFGMLTQRVIDTWPDEATFPEPGGGGGRGVAPGGEKGSGPGSGIPKVKSEEQNK